MFSRYNLKRKVSELPPVTVEDFQNRVIQARSQEQEEFVDKGLYCKACNKFFKSQNSHDNHLNSKKHRESLIAYLDNNKNDEEEIEDVIVSVKSVDILEERRLQKVEEDDSMDAESVDSDEWDDDTENPIANNNCIFCDHHSKNLVNNMKPMSIAHSFFIPDAEFCSDLEGLLSYLAEKVVKGNNLTFLKKFIINLT